MPSAVAVRNPRAAALQGHRAGIASRVAADGIDWLAVQGIYLAILGGLGVARFLIEGGSFRVPSPDVSVTLVAQLLLLVVYLTAGWAGTGRTLGKTIMGLRAVRRDGRALGVRRAFGRALLCAFFPWMLLWVMVNRRNLGIHDLIVRSSVVYDWTMS